MHSLRRLLDRKCSEWEQDGGKVGFQMARLGPTGLFEMVPPNAVTQKLLGNQDFISVLVKYTTVVVW